MLFDLAVEIDKVLSYDSY